jgi:leucyl aminopeptidase
VTTLSLSAKDPASIKADALVIGVASGPSGPLLVGGDALPPALRSSLTGSLEGLGVSGAVDSLTRVPAGAGVAAPVVALVGLGKAPARGSSYPHETLRRAAGSAARQLVGLKVVTLALPAPDDAALAAVAEGALLGAYTFSRYRSSAASAASGKPPKEPPASIVVATSEARTSAAKTVVRRAHMVARAVHATRDLINAAPVDLPPSVFADAAVAAAAELPVTVKVLDEKKLLKGGYGGLLGVGMGSSRPPRLVRVGYAPDGATRHVALVGKGITFDSGGISIKPAQGMEAMKSDMSGAAAVLSTVLAAAELKLPVQVTGWLCLAENMPSGSAQRPSDVLTVRGGRTVEVLNTDAEGRLVLADGIVAAGEEDPDLIIDVATLTGAQMIALGHRTSAIMANDETLRTRLYDLSVSVGEQFWPMPLPPELRSSMDSAVADIANIGDRFGGMLVAGLFLQEFVPTRTGPDDAKSPVPWAHLDIASPAFNTGAPFGYTPKGGTGVAVRTLLALLEDEAGQARG